MCHQYEDLLSLGSSVYKSIAISLSMSHYLSVLPNGSQGTLSFPAPQLWGRTGLGLLVCKRE